MRLLLMEQTMEHVWNVVFHFNMHQIVCSMYFNHGVYFHVDLVILRSKVKNINS